jgi:hypothetical protein
MPAQSQMCTTEQRTQPSRLGAGPLLPYSLGVHSSSPLYISFLGRRAFFFFSYLHQLLIVGVHSSSSHFTSASYFWRVFFFSCLHQLLIVGVHSQDPNIQSVLLANMS